MENVFEVFVVDGNCSKVNCGIYRKEEDAHNHLLSIGCECKQRMNTETDDNGHYLYKSDTSLFFNGQSALVYIKPIALK